MYIQRAMAGVSFEVEADRNPERPATAAERLGDGLETPETRERLERGSIECRVTRALGEPDLADASIGVDDKGQGRHAGLSMTPGAGRITLLAGDGALQGDQIIAFGAMRSGRGVARRR